MQKKFMEKIKIRVVKEIPHDRIFQIVDKDLWESKKDDFISQINCGKDMGSYIDSDYCKEEYGIISWWDSSDDVNSEWGEIISMEDENGKQV